MQYINFAIIMQIWIVSLAYSFFSNYNCKMEMMSGSEF